MESRQFLTAAYFYFDIANVEKWYRITYPKMGDKRRKVLVECVGYEEREAQHEGISYYKHYREIPLGEGGWFRTDDGYVVYCRKYEGVYQHKYGTYILRRFVTDIGTWYYSLKEGEEKAVPIIKFQAFKGGGYRPLFTKNDYVERLPSHRLRAFVTAYVHMVLKGRIDYDQLGRIMSGSVQKSYQAYAKKILKLWKVKQMIQEDLKKELEKQGIDMKNVVNKFEEAYGVARAKKDAQSMIRVAENYVDIFKQKAPEQNPYGALPTDVQYEDISKSIAEGEESLKQVAQKPAEPEYDELSVDPDLNASITELMTYPPINERKG